MTPAASDLILEKESVRRRVLAERDALPPEMRAAAAEAIAARPLPVPLPAQPEVSGFLPIRSEINPLPLMRVLAAAGAQLALPVVVGRGHPLRLRAWMPGETLVRKQWGIREPEDTSPELAPDIVLAPLAAFDRRGSRIGYGAAYYDMTINALRAIKPAIVIGLAYAMQEIENVPTEPHDAKLDFIMTERETIDCRGR